jgi:ribosomal protein S21
VTGSDLERELQRLRRYWMTELGPELRRRRHFLPPAERQRAKQQRGRKRVLRRLGLAKKRGG